MTESFFPNCVVATGVDKAFISKRLSWEKDLPEKLLNFYDELNSLDYSRIGRIVNVIKSTLADQSDSLDRLLNAVYQKKEPDQ